MNFQKILVFLTFISISVWCGSISFGAASNYSSTNNLFPFHPPFMAFGFLFCFTSGILTSVLGWKKGYHIFFQILGTICITIGFAIVVQAKSYVNEEHFKSPHSIIGFISVLSCWFQLITGIAKINKSKNLFLKNHGGFGFFTYILGISALLIASVNYLCGNILIEIKSNFCVDEEEISSIYSATLVIICGLSVMLYINKPTNKVSIFSEKLKDYQTIYS